MVRTSLLSAPATPAPRAARWFLLAGLAATGIACTPEASTAPPQAEADKSTLQKVEDKVVEGAKKVEDVAGSAAKATGNAIVKTGEQLETEAAASVRKNVGETAGNAVESVGKGLEKAGGSLDKGGDKLKENAAPK